MPFFKRIIKSVLLNICTQASQPQALISAHHMVLYWESPSRGAYVRAYEMDTLRKLIHERGLDQDDVRLNTPFRLDPSYSRVIPFGTKTSVSYMPLPSGGLRQNGVGVGHGGEGVGGLNGKSSGFESESPRSITSDCFRGNELAELEDLVRESNREEGENPGTLGPGDMGVVPRLPLN